MEGILVALKIPLIQHDGQRNSERLLKEDCPWCTSRLYLYDGFIHL